MKKELASNKAIKHIICGFILIIIFLITISRVNAQNISTLQVEQEAEEIIPLKPLLDKSLLELEKIKIEINTIKIYDKPRIIEKNIDYYIDLNEKTLNFFSEAFGYNIEDVKENLKERNINITEIEETNIASLTNSNGEIIKFQNKEQGIVEYFYYLSNNNILNRNKKYESYNGNSSYVEKLIIYYTNIYNNVDTDIALSIGAAESGYYTVKYMLNRNNVYGGMSSRGLIVHDNIELGVLNYIKMLSNNYFGKGLSTISQIGYVYCPVTNEYGYKTASPHWINLVNTAKAKYMKYDKNITIEDLI